MKKIPILTSTCVLTLAICVAGVSSRLTHFPAFADQSSGGLEVAQNTPPQRPATDLIGDDETAEPPAESEPAQQTGDAKPAQPEPAQADQTAAKEPPKENPEARAKLQQAREKLSSSDIRTITAEMQELVHIGSGKFRAEGRYLQATGNADQRKVRIEFDVRYASPGKSGDSIGSLLQVCDGQVLWTQHQIGEQSRITRRDVQQILNAARESGGIDPNRLAIDLGLGGLPALLAAIEQAMTFEVIREEHIGDKPFVLIEGRWNQAYQQRFQGAASPGSSTDRLPPHIPDKVSIYLEPELLFPRRILYSKRPASKDFMRPMVTLDFVKIELNAPLKDDEFEFVPPAGVPPADITRMYLQQIQMHSAATAQPGQADQSGLSNPLEQPGQLTPSGTPPQTTAP